MAELKLKIEGLPFFMFSISALLQVVNFGMSLHVFTSIGWPLVEFVIFLKEGMFRIIDQNIRKLLVLVAYIASILNGQAIYFSLFIYTLSLFYL